VLRKIAVQVSERADQFQAQIRSLELLAMTYNDVKHSLLPVEVPLLHPKMEAVANTIETRLMVFGQHS
jgi:hypothetical protein